MHGLITGPRDDGKAKHLWGYSSIYDNIGYAGPDHVGLSFDLKEWEFGKGWFVFEDENNIQRVVHPTWFEEVKGEAKPTCGCKCLDLVVLNRGCICGHVEVPYKVKARGY